MPKRFSHSTSWKKRITAAGPSPIFTKFPVQKSRQNAMPPWQDNPGLLMLFTKHPDNCGSNFNHHFFV